MPYIPQQERDFLTSRTYQQLLDLSAEMAIGDLNFIISNMLWIRFSQHPSYKAGNEIMGVLNCVQQEFYRRVLAPYEDKAIERNGDLHEKSISTSSRTA